MRHDLVEGDGRPARGRGPRAAVRSGWRDHQSQRVVTVRGHSVIEEDEGAATTLAPDTARQARRRCPEGPRRCRRHGERVPGARGRWLEAAMREQRRGQHPGVVRRTRGPLDQLRGVAPCGRDRHARRRRGRGADRRRARRRRPDRTPASTLSRTKSQEVERAHVGVRDATRGVRLVKPGGAPPGACQLALSEVLLAEPVPEPRPSARRPESAHAAQCGHAERDVARVERALLGVDRHGHPGGSVRRRTEVYAQRR